MNIVVLAGGLSPERNVSLATGTLVCNALIETGHHAIVVDSFLGGPAGDAAQIFASATVPVAKMVVAEQVPDLDAVRAQRVGGCGLFGDNVLTLCQAADIVFLALHGGDGENGRIQATFDALGIRYTGSGYLGCACAMDKKLTKLICSAAGVVMPKGVYLRRGMTIPAPREIAPFPLVVKPCSGGSSIGVSIVEDETQFAHALQEAFRYESDVLVEERIVGREFSVGVLGDEALPSIEIIPKEGWYDYKNKYQAGSTTEVCPSDIPAAVEARMRQAALDVFHALDLHGYARMDFIWDGADGIYCLEANNLPGMTATSLIPQEAAAIGIDYPTLCNRVITIALQK